ncbi:MAG: bifunctional oligoribonuclease/PAP phosphatase NrnA [Cytophagaceae bacterium]|nr:bifunctional oligoribonuclease/PAP phosphatase NrnA [Cytophagaceae bacterium]
MRNLQDLKELLSSPKKIVITTHHKPDADALGSSLALWGYLRKKKHEVKVITPTDYPTFLNWMNGNDEVIIFNKGNEALSQKLVDEADVVFCLDFSALSRINELGEIIRKASAKKVLIDHHLEPEDFADINFSDTGAAATAVLIYKIIIGMGDREHLDTCIGECIYAGIMTDTGSFRHPSTNKEVHLIIAELINLAVDISKIHRLIYDNNTETRLKFLGYALLNKLVVIPEYYTSYIAISAAELNKFDSQTGDTEGLVNYALSLETVVMAAVIIEREDAVKISFRSKGEFSVNEFARKHFEGGGHRNAAGGKSSLSLEETVKKFKEVLPLYKEELNQHYKAEKLIC